MRSAAEIAERMRRMAASASPAGFCSASGTLLLNIRCTSEWIGHLYMAASELDRPARDESAAAALVSQIRGALGPAAADMTGPELVAHIAGLAPAEAIPQEAQQ